MSSCVAILTYRRLHALQEMLAGLCEHCARYRIGIFEDCGNMDGTGMFLRRGLPEPRPDLMAVQYVFAPGITACLGDRNLGVSGNSNRALKWFLDGTEDHLCLCNDDLHVVGDFPAFYRQAHRDLGTGFFAFNDFADSPRHRWIIARSRGYRVKIFPQMTGIMMSVTRQTVNKVGYFDTRFGKFGQEHVDWTHRIRLAGELKLDGLDQVCLDVEPARADGSAGPPVLKHQNVATSVNGPERTREDTLAETRIREAVARYRTESYYRPFSLVWPERIGLGGQGIKPEEMPGYREITRS
jgi:GT2 family glycosyltransferase